MSFLSLLPRDIKASGFYVVIYHSFLDGDSSPHRVFLAGGLAGRIEFFLASRTIDS